MDFEEFEKKLSKYNLDAEVEQAILKLYEPGIISFNFNHIFGILDTNSNARYIETQTEDFEEKDTIFIIYITSDCNLDTANEMIQRIAEKIPNNKILFQFYVGDKSMIKALVFDN